MKVFVSVLISIFFTLQTFASNYTVSFGVPSENTPPALSSYNLIKRDETDNDIIKIQVSEGKNIYFVPFNGSENPYKTNTTKHKLKPGTLLEIKRLCEPAVDKSIEKNSDEYNLYAEDINEDKRNVGNIYSIKAKNSDKQHVTIDFSVTDKSHFFQITENLFSEDEVKIKYYDNTLSFSATIELNKDYLILYEHITNVYDVTPFWGEIPFIGNLFKTKGTSRSSREICSIKISDN